MLAINFNLLSMITTLLESCWCEAILSNIGGSAARTVPLAWLPHPPFSTAH